MTNKQKILVFDDEMEELSKVYIGLLLKNFVVEATTDPSEISERAKRFKPDIVIVNNDVVGFDGHELCSLVKRQMNKPIILMIDKNSSQLAKLDHCSADEIIMKPIDMIQMVDTVNRLLATHQ
jgi:DNA-binding response OmpR family regulator